MFKKNLRCKKCIGHYYQSKYYKIRKKTSIILRIILIDYFSILFEKIYYFIKSLFKMLFNLIA